MISKIKYFESDTGKTPILSNFLDYYNFSLNDVYGKSGDRNFSRMMATAGLIPCFENKDEDTITKRLKNLFHINSRKLINFVIKLSTNMENLKDCKFDIEEKLMLGMIYYSFYLDAPAKLGYTSFENALTTLYEDNKIMIKEAFDILQHNYQHIDFVDKQVNLGFICLIDLYCSYSTDQTMAALGYFQESVKPTFREGVKHFKAKKLDVFFITLNKSEKDYSPSTLYDDYAINERLCAFVLQKCLSQTTLNFLVAK